MQADVERYRENLRDELNGSELYAALAAVERDPLRKDLFLQLAQTRSRSSVCSSSATICSATRICARSVAICRAWMTTLTLTLSATAPSCAKRYCAAAAVCSTCALVPPKTSMS